MNEPMEVTVWCFGGWDLSEVKEPPTVEDVVRRLGVKKELRRSMVALFLLAMGMTLFDIRVRMGFKGDQYLAHFTNSGVRAWQGDTVFRDQYDRGLKIDKR